MELEGESKFVHPPESENSVDIQQLIKELENIGAPHPDLHAGGKRIWVNPYFLPIEQAKKLIDYCKDNNVKYKDLDTELIRQYAGFGKYLEDK